MKAAFTKNQLKAALLFAADQDVRFYLNAVLFNGETGELVATDGHRAIVIETSWRAEGSVIIPRSLIEEVLKITSKVIDCINLEYDEEAKLITLGELTDKAIEAKFPDYAHLKPDKDKSIPSPAVFNPNYLVDASKAHCLLNDLKVAGNFGLEFMVMRPRIEKLDYLETVELLRKQSATHFGSGFTITIMPLRV